MHTTMKVMAMMTDHFFTNLVRIVKMSYIVTARPFVLSINFFQHNCETLTFVQFHKLNSESISFSDRFSAFCMTSVLLPLTPESQ